MLGKAVQSAKLSVLMVELVAGLGALVGIAYMTVGSTSMMDDISSKMAEDMRLSDGEIATGGNSEEMKAYHEALLSKAALPGEAARNSGRLHVGLVSFRDLKVSGSDSYFPVTLSVGKLSRAATLIIADGPAHWSVANARISQRAKLAFEGKSPVRASNVTQGLLAGTRIKPFDAKDVSDINSLRAEPRQFCDTMQAWSAFFGIALEKVSVSKITVGRDTARINASDRGFKAPDGRVTSRGTAASLCKK